jgi:predicted adenine nucleotide alpha hydrolase (AANH) superfamily ATPase
LSEFGDKKELWKKTQELSKKYELYHQKYCGCQFSFRPTKKKKICRKNRVAAKFF